MKNLYYITLFLSILLGTSTVLIWREYVAQKDTNAELVKNNMALTADLGEALKLRTYNISLNPTITNKVSSVLGNTRQVTFQYYFKMDGNTIEMVPDTTITIKK